MSRVDDLIGLLKPLLDIILINESQNARTVFIFVDDLCELATKSYLQENNSDWDPVDRYSTNGKPYYKGFGKVLDELQQFCQGDDCLLEILERVSDRRNERNYFVHDHSLTGFTITTEKCFESLCDLFDLLSILFPEFDSRVEGNSILRTQIAVIKLKREFWRNGSLENRYRKILQEWRHGEDTRYLPTKSVVLLRDHSFAYEYLVIYLDSTGLYEAMHQNELVI